MKTLLLFSSILFAATAFASAADRPVKVYILAGQSNMVGMGQVGDNGSTQFPTHVSDEPNAGEGLTLSTYECPYHPSTDYDKLPAIATEAARIGYWDHQHYKSEGYHYHLNAGTYMRIGEAMGKAMVELQKGK